MQFSVHELLGLLAGERSAAPKILQQKLNVVQPQALEQLQLVLDILEKLGLLEKLQGRYRRIADEEVVSGRVRCSSKGFCFVTPDLPESEEVFIIEGGLKNAWNGDRVLVRLMKKASRRRKPEGEVLLVTERANLSVVGRLASIDGDAPQVVPLDDRLGGTIELVGENGAVDTEQIVEVVITRYPLGSRPAKSRLLRILGNANDPQVDIDLVCNRYRLNFEFPDAVREAASTLPAELAETDREDLTSLDLHVLGSDPAQMAVSLVPQAEGWELGLHIPDLTYLVSVGSVLDIEGRERAFGTRLRGRLLQLWPPELIERACLKPGTVRRSWSVLVQLDAAAQVRTYRWNATLVRAGTPFEGPLPESYAQVAEALTRQGIALLSEPGDPRVFVELLESLMGQHLAHLHLPAPFLAQQPPQGSEVLDWLRLARSCGLNVPDAEPPVELQASQYHDWLVAQPTRTDNPALRELLKATLEPSEFGTAPALHFSRNSGAVVPFAAPLESYADLVVQRILAQVSEDGRDRKTPRSKVNVDLKASSAHGLIDWPVLKPKQQKDWEELLPALANHLSTRARQVVQAGKDLEGFEKISQLNGHTEPLHGLITGVQSYGFFVAVEEPFVEGLVHVSGLKDDWYTYQAREPALVGRRSRRRFQIGDSVKVQVKSIDYYRQQVDLMVLPGEPEAVEEPEGEAVTS